MDFHNVFPKWIPEVNLQSESSNSIPKVDLVIKVDLRNCDASDKVLFGNQLKHLNPQACQFVILTHSVSSASLGSTVFATGLPGPVHRAWRHSVALRRTEGAVHRLLRWPAEPIENRLLWRPDDHRPEVARRGQG